MAELLKALYDKLEDNGDLTETESASKFRDRFASDGDAEDLFSEAVRDTRFAGFKDGWKAALDLLTEIQGGGGK